MEETFLRELRLTVPAAPFAGSPPSRKQDFEFRLPGGYEINRAISPDRHGASVSGRNLSNLEERLLSFAEIDNGVRITWELANPHSFPITGRTGSLTIELTGNLIAAPAQVKLGFSDKYEAIRRRFFDEFYFDGHVAQEIEGGRIKFADQTIYMGQALIFLATEAYIKERIGVDVKPTLNTIQQILDEFDRLDLAAEDLFGFPPALDGFIVRDNITGSQDPRLKGRFTEVGSDWQKPEDAAPSGDQIFGTLYGLWFVARLVEDEAIIQHTRALSDRIFGYAKRCKFELKLPDGEPVERGADMRWLASLMHGLNKDITGIDRFHESQFLLLGVPQTLASVATFWDHAGARAEAALRGEFDLPMIGKVSIPSFSAHIALMALAPTDIWTKEEFEAAAMSVNHHLAVLTNSLARGTRPSTFHYDDVQAILDRCPDSGPRSDLPVETGWQKDNRWIRSRNIARPDDGHKAYNGVDFLMFHNLSQIVFQTNQA